MFFPLLFIYFVFIHSFVHTIAFIVRVTGFKPGHCGYSVTLSAMQKDPSIPLFTKYWLHNE